MTIVELKKFVEQNVKVTLFDNTVLEGKLGFVEDFSAKYGYKKPNYFFVGDVNFKVSHIKHFEK